MCILCIYLYLLMCSSIGVKNETEPIALNALSSRLQGRKRFFSVAGVFLPVTFVASTSPRLTFPILGHPVDEEERQALNAYRFSCMTHVTSFPPIYRAFPRAQWTIDHLYTTCTRLFSILISRVDPGQRAKVSVSKVKKTFRLLRLDIDFECWLMLLSTSKRSFRIITLLFIFLNVANFYNQRFYVCAFIFRFYMLQNYFI